MAGQLFVGWKATFNSPPIRHQHPWDLKACTFKRDTKTAGMGKKYSDLTEIISI